MAEPILKVKHLRTHFLMDGGNAVRAVSKEKKTKVKNRKLAAISHFIRKKPMGFAGLIVLVLLLLVAIFADVIAPVKMQAGTLPGSILDKPVKPSGCFRPRSEPSRSAME